MKIKLITIITITVLVVVIRLAFMTDVFDNIEIVYDKVDYIEHDIYYYNGDTLTSITYKFEELDYIYVFEMLTCKSNTVEVGYYSKLVLSTIVYDVNVIGKILYFNISEDFLRYNEDDDRKIVNQLKYTFSNLGFDKLILKVDSNILYDIGSINISSGIPLQNK